ncbi:uncharacterized protein NECHADRAFT_80110 [Fusarium vanettenii 77-13-4]|uniref:Uncharacterized protein n=1 Tax=Fusarium vanettenii (strain ATCC MYA-4622 / CBS 123669 / FGSC 9596 / NRRL 45880 / 77-13-4) TaxID=660122 RepID=C7Z145_FUSV7|nr:uncharacterized protein NECHADRAFT_80110 [Fusarium vanettenii 77-13-4]EEU42505.1 predicted protein [Fusarium vanettenii 77-13-4]
MTCKVGSANPDIAGLGSPVLSVDRVRAVVFRDNPKELALDQAITMHLQEIHHAQSTFFKNVLSKCHSKMFTQGPPRAPINATPNPMPPLVTYKSSTQLAYF